MSQIIFVKNCKNCEYMFLTFPFYDIIKKITFLKGEIVLKKTLKGMYRNTFNSVVINFVKPPHVVSAENSIEKIINGNHSVCRYGDGEIALILGGSINFQKANPLLAERLRTILKSNEENLMVCIPDVFSNLDKYTDEFKEFWVNSLKHERLKWYRLINRKSVYYDALLSRFYTSLKDKNTSKNMFEKIKKIWEDKDLLIIEGEHTRMGVGNDLFDNANSIERILAPKKDAFDWYDDILKTAESRGKSKLILISLGATATVLAHDLHMKGFQAIDIGHIDVQYEYSLRNTKGRINLPTKYVNEVEGGDLVEDVHDEKYLKSIVEKIGV